MASPSARRVLFVGNSLTFWQEGGLDGLFREWGLDAAAETAPGVTLVRLWKMGKAYQRIQEGGWDVVVLQDDMPEYRSDPRRERWRAVHEQSTAAVAKFVEAIRAIGATPVIFMSHEYARLAHTSIDDICAAHKVMENVLDVAIAPAGLAHRLAAAQLDQLAESCPLLDPDEEHPSIAGRFLNAATIAATVFGTDSLSGICLHGGGASDRIDDTVLELLRAVAVEVGSKWAAMPVPSE